MLKTHSEWRTRCASPVTPVASRSSPGGFLVDSTQMLRARQKAESQAHRNSTRIYCGASGDADRSIPVIVSSVGNSAGTGSGGMGMSFDATTPAARIKTIGAMETSADGCQSKYSETIIL